MKNVWIALIAGAFLMMSCGQKSVDTISNEQRVADSAAAAENQDSPELQADQEKKDEASDTAANNQNDQLIPFVQTAVEKADQFVQQNDYVSALRVIYEAQLKLGEVDTLEKKYQALLDEYPMLHAEPRKLTPGVDLSTMKRIGGGSSLVYKFIKDGTTFAAYKPFQKRYQSNYRSEIAAYRLCPWIKCGFDVPVNEPVYFDFDEFSSLYARNPANVKSEFAEIIPTKLEGGQHRIDGTQKEWINDYAEYPIEFSEFWKAWLNPGKSREDLDQKASILLPEFAKKHKRGQKFADKLGPHFADLSIYSLARQISNLLVFDFLINNWDRFSGSPTLFGVNCQFANGRFMSIDNGAGFSQTPNSKPERHLRDISRFSRLTYDAIRNLDHDKMLGILFPNATEFELEKYETFWKQRERYLEYVKMCVEKNGERETFFFE